MWEREILEELRDLSGVSGTVGALDEAAVEVRGEDLGEECSRFSAITQFSSRERMLCRPIEGLSKRQQPAAHLIR